MSPPNQQREPRGQGAPEPRTPPGGVASGIWVPAVDQGVAYRLHLCGLRRPRPWWVAPAYARQDAALRRQAKGGASGRAPQGGCDGLAWVLGGGEEGSREPPDDEAWFATRWALGDREAGQGAAARVAAEAAAWGGGRLVGDGPVRVMASAAVAGAVAHEGAGICAVGPRAPGGLALLRWIGARLVPRLDLPEDLGRPLVELVAVHTAATLYLRTAQLDQARTEALLKTAGRALLPARGDEDRARGDLRLLAEAVLGQPPGEVGRITSGWHRGRTDRLHRAWQRGFFVPRWVDIEAVLASLGASRGEGAAESAADGAHESAESGGEGGPGEGSRIAQ